MFPSILDGLRLPWPAPWNEMFGRDAPLLVEVGFGNGRFLLDLAQSRPETNVLGVEISLPALRRAERNIARYQITNLRLVQATAEFALWILCPPASISRLYVNFPDPWPKGAHHHRRLINDGFLHLAATRLTALARFDIATDHDEYAGVIHGYLARSPYFDSRLDKPYLTQDNSRLRTKYEQKALAEGRTCYYFKWRRNYVAAPDKFPLPQELPMPHVVLNTPLSLDEIGRRFQPVQFTSGGAQVRLVNVYRSLQDDSLLVNAYVNEEPLAQHVGLMIRQRRPGEFMLNLHELGFPRPTAGVHLAIHQLAEWIVNLHPGAQVVHHNLRDPA